MLHEPLFDPPYDVVIVGARCAGAATALLLARAGVRVLAVDRQGYGTDTLSTHALMRPAVTQLSRWGLLDPLVRGGTPLIGTTTFHYGDETVEIPIRSEPGIPGLVAPRRTLLDRLLVDAARGAGATILHDVAVQDLVFDGRGRVRGIALKDPSGRQRIIHAGTVVGADGLSSMVARKVGAEMLVRGRASVAHVFGYAAMPELEGYHWYFREGLSGGVIPTNGSLACMVVSLPTERFDQQVRFNLAAAHRKLLGELDPRLGAHVTLHDAAPLRAFRGTQSFMRRAHGKGWTLVGDAGFFRDPLTSHGISDALRDAEGAAHAILAGSECDLRRFQDERDQIALPILDATDAICAFDWTLKELPVLHKRLSETMKAEVAALATRECPAPGPARSRASVSHQRVLEMGEV